MTNADLEDFVCCYHPEDGYERTETYSADNPDGRFHKFSIEEITEKDKASLDIFWIKNKLLADPDNPPSPDELANNITESLQGVLDSFTALQTQLNKG